MRIDNRSLSIVVLAAAVLALAGGLLAMLAAVAAPYLGLGVGEDYLFFRFWGFARSEMAEASVLLIVAGFFLGGFALVLAKMSRITVTELAVGRFDGISRSSGRGFVKAKEWMGVVVNRCAPEIIEAWGLLNRDWAVVLILTPFAAFILGVSFFALPAGPWLTLDSQTYLAFNLTRTLGYPIFVRLIALVSDDPAAIAAVQLVLGLGSVLFFAEVLQRVFRNCLVSVGVGVLLMFNWPILEHAFYVLTDYPFFAILCFQFGIVFLAILEPNPRRLALVALTTALAVVVRPAALFLVGAVPFLILVHPKSWRRILICLAAPLVLLLLAQAGVNKAVFDYFGLSRWTGYPMTANAMFMLRETTPSEHPELVRRLYAAAKPYQEKYAAIGGSREKALYNISVNNLMLAEAGRIVQRFGHERGIITTTDTSRHLAFVRIINESSPLNRQMGRMGIGVAPSWVWFDSLLSGLAVSSVMHNLSGWADLMWPNLVFSWDIVIPVSLMPEGDFKPYARMRLDRPDLGFGETFPILKITDVPLFKPWGFNRIANTITIVNKIIPISFVVLAATVAALALFAWFLVRNRHIPPQMAGLAYLAGCLVVYHFEVDAASIPLPRLLGPLIPAALTLLFSPLLLISFRRWEFIGSLKN